MVKIYGGVPIITIPQSISESDDELYVHRNTEKEVYDFIQKSVMKLLKSYQKYLTNMEGN
jgi:hypothetical protein